MIEENIGSTSKGHLQTEKYLLTNVEWRNGYGASPETGIRFKQRDGTWDGFELIQHGSWDFEWVNKIIIMGLDKGWDINRIGNFFHNYSNRNRK